MTHKTVFPCHNSCDLLYVWIALLAKLKNVQWTNQNKFWTSSHGSTILLIVPQKTAQVGIVWDQIKIEKKKNLWKAFIKQTN